MIVCSLLAGNINLYKVCALSDQCHDYNGFSESKD